MSSDSKVINTHFDPKKKVKKEQIPHPREPLIPPAV